MVGSRFLLPLIVLSFALGRAESPPAGDVANARAAVEANLKDKAGQDYAKAALAAFAKSHAKTLKACQDSVTAPDTSRFEAFFMLSRRGMVKTSLLSPATKVGECLLRGSDKDAFPPPPGPNHWILIRSSDIRG